MSVTGETVWLPLFFEYAFSSFAYWMDITYSYKNRIWEDNGEIVALNKLAYMEPLCTIPEYRRRGLAAAALSELYRRMKALGATHMTGGWHDFYKAIGYKPVVKWTWWEKL